MVLSLWGWAAQSSKLSDARSQNENGVCFLFFLIHPWSFMLFCPMTKTKRVILSSWCFGFGIRFCSGFAYCTGILSLSDILPACCTSLVLLLQILVLARVFLCIQLLKPYLKSPFVFCSYGYYLKFKLPYNTVLCDNMLWWWLWWWWYFCA